MHISRKVKLGIIGCGATTEIMYGPILRYLENGELIAVMDIDESRAKRAQSMHGVKKAYTDLDEMLKDDEIEAVIIGSPVFLHQQHVVSAAQAGKHILCEKPMARTIEECDEIIRVCRENKVILMVAFMKRFDKSMKYAYELIEKGRLGKVFQVLCNWSFYMPGTISAWRDSLSTWGGLFQDHGSHTVDLCRWWMGDIETVSGEISILYKKREVEDQAVVIFRHKNGGISIHRMSRMVHKRDIEYYLIDGSRASLEIEHGAGSFSSIHPFSMKLHEKGRKVTNITRHNVANLDEEIRKSGRYKKELEHFCDCVLNNKTPLTRGEDGRKAIEAINALYLSSWKGEKVKLPLKKSPNMEKLFIEIRNKGIDVVKD